MRKWLLISVILCSINSPELSARQIPPDRIVLDSLFRLKPHDSQVQKAMIYMEVEEIIRESFPEKSFSYLVSALRISIFENNDSLKANVMMQMGDFYTLRRKFKQAQEQYLAARRTFQRIGQVPGEVRALAQIGMINRILGNHTIALDYLQMAEALAWQTSDQTVKGKVYEQIGLTYRDKKDRQASYTAFNRALLLFIKAGDRKREFRIRSQIGSKYLDEDRNEEGLAYYKELVQEADTSDDELRGILYTRIGHIYDKMDDTRSSLYYNNKALQCRQRWRALSAISSSLINIAGDYYNMDKPDSGKLYMDSGMIMAQKLDMKQFMANGYNHLKNYYLRHGDKSRAMDYFARYSAISDQISLEKYRNNIAIIVASQKLQRLQESGNAIVRRHNIQTLNLKYHAYQSLILQILTGLAGFSMLVVVMILLVLRWNRRKMQALNMQLSAEINDREATEVQTYDRETQYKFITDNSIDFITRLDDENKRIYSSPACLQVYGYDAEEMLAKSPEELTHPDFIDFVDSEYDTMIETRASRQFTYQALKKDGSVFWVESVLNPLFDSISGSFKGTIGVSRDIQERKAKEFAIMEGTKQKENLLKEIHHRVKNNFAILVSLINMQMAQTKNPELLQSLTNLQLRIRTMSLVHEMLYRSNDFEKISFPGYLRSLASVIASTYNRRDIDLVVEADEVVMDIEASIPLGLMVNELLSNSFKHAFPDGRQGKIRILFEIDSTGSTYTLVVKDNGVGFPEGAKPEQYKTMGLQVVQILCAQVEGKMAFANNRGASFTISFQPPAKSTRLHKIISAEF